MEVSARYVHENPSIGRSGPKADRLAASEPAANADRQSEIDPVDLTPDAEALLNAGDETARGKSAQSPAHRARALIAEYPHLAALSFGQVVSGLNHGTLDLTAPPSPDDPEDSEQPAGEEETTNTGPMQDPAPVPAGATSLANILASALSAGNDVGRRSADA